MIIARSYRTPYASNYGLGNFVPDRFDQIATGSGGGANTPAPTGSTTEFACGDKFCVGQSSQAIAFAKDIARDINTLNSYARTTNTPGYRPGSASSAPPPLAVDGNIYPQTATRFNDIYRLYAFTATAAPGKETMASIVVNYPAIRAMLRNFIAKGKPSAAARQIAQSEAFAAAAKAAAAAAAAQAAAAKIAADARAAQAKIDADAAAAQAKAAADAAMRMINDQTLPQPGAGTQVTVTPAPTPYVAPKIGWKVWAGVAAAVAGAVAIGIAHKHS